MSDSHDLSFLVYKYALLNVMQTKKLKEFLTDHPWQPHHSLGLWFNENNAKDIQKQETVV